ncbi:methyl-accepting chemotaxis protein [Halarcobacter bivalviorum]|uniref:MCP-domain signal transduction protein n=2 Tax=Halarcobacter bivalviorum TaxID=663364 RepID=A0AB33GV30_9BACT|nr:methyl-accepting chemotaxis protein [Halarcobacter bivalviorum]AXH12718.1 MCP-domain signal transduction protein [Halarcobacter bivalviorum]
MNNFSIKRKLTIAFSIISILLILVSAYSIFGIDKSITGFKTYRTMSNETHLINQIQANMLILKMNVKDFISTGSQKNIDEFMTYFNINEKYIKEVKSSVEDKRRATLIKEMETDLNEYKKQFADVIIYMSLRDELFTNLSVYGKNIESLLTSIMKEVEKSNNSNTALEVAQSIRTLLLARLHTTKFLISSKEVDNQEAKKEFTLLKKRIAIINEQLQNKNNIESFEEATKFINFYISDLKGITEAINITNSFIDKMNILEPKIAQTAETIKESVKKEQTFIGNDVSSTNSAIQIILTLVSIIVLTFIALIAIFIPRNISSELKEFQEGLLNFFKYVNREISDIELFKSNSKTEIGIMAEIVNKNILKTKKSIEEDKKIIEETVLVLSEFEQGDLCQRITTEVSNPSLNKLKDVLNNMGNTLENNIENILDVLEEFSNYNYLKKVDTKGIKEHLEKLATGVNSLGISITKMLIENKKNGLVLNDSAKTLLGNVDILNRSSNEAATSLEETASALEEITSNIALTTNKISQMNNLTKNVTNSANKGESLALKTNEAMNEIDKQVSSINEAISVIDQIAFQTNILSLNAAVEAATAGEAGKGFAVVSAEVRNLANRSAEAAKQIKTLVETATIKANEGKEIANEMKEGYSNLKENINETVELISDISNASREQQIGILQINSAINSLDTQTQNNVQIASKTQNIAINTSEIANTIVKNADEKEFEGKNTIKINS